jgi:hypothetical protein
MTSRGPPDRTDIDTHAPTARSRGSDAYDAAWAAILAAIVNDRMAGDVIAKLSLTEIDLLVRLIVESIEQRDRPRRAAAPRSPAE